MKKSIILAIAVYLGIPALAQDGAKQNAATVQKKEIVYSTQSEKDKSIKEQEQRLKVNTSDPTYPKDLLEKEKKELSESKKAKVKH
jgi:hypothetical protein